MVDGDHVVLFRTFRKVKPGQELLLDYGEDYWKHHGSDDDESGEEDIQEALKKRNRDAEDTNEDEFEYSDSIN